MCSRRNNHLAILLSCSMEGTISCNTTGWAKNKWNVFSIFSVLEKNYYKRQFGRKLKRKATSKGNFLADFVKPKGCCCGFNCTFTLIYQTVISPSNRIHDCFSPSFFPLELEWPPKYWKNSLGWKSRCWTLLAYYYIIIYHHSLFAFFENLYTYCYHFTTPIFQHHSAAAALVSSVLSQDDLKKEEFTILGLPYFVDTYSIYLLSYFSSATLHFHYYQSFQISPKIL